MCRGVKKFGGQLYTNSHVESINLDSSGKATGACASVCVCLFVSTCMQGHGYL